MKEDCISLYSHGEVIYDWHDGEVNHERRLYQFVFSW